MDTKDRNGETMIDSGTKAFINLVDELIKRNVLPLELRVGNVSATFNMPETKAEVIKQNNIKEQTEKEKIADLERDMFSSSG